MSAPAAWPPPTRLRRRISLNPTLPTCNRDRGDQKNEVEGRRFDVRPGGEAPDAVLLYELHDDHAARRMHLENGRFRSFDARLSCTVADKQVQVFDNVA